MQQGVRHLHQLIRLGGLSSGVSSGHSIASFFGGFDWLGQLDFMAQHRLDHQLDQPLAVIQSIVGNTILLFADVRCGWGGRCCCLLAGGRLPRGLQRQGAGEGQGAAAFAGRCRVVALRWIDGGWHWPEVAHLAALGLLLPVLHLPLEVVVIDAHTFALGAIHLVSYRPVNEQGLTPNRTNQGGG